MGRITEGRSRVIFTIDRWVLPIGNGVELINSSYQPFPVTALLEYAPLIKGSDEDDGVPEYCEFVNLHLLAPLYLTSPLGVSAHISIDCNLLDILDDKTYEYFILQLKRQAAQGML